MRRHRQRSNIDRAWTVVLLRLRVLGRRRMLTVAVFGLLGFAGSALVSIATGGPLPAIHDEFSYLLAADTFASGRLTNPAHPYWQHFETFHVVMQPTYASKYPPAQGLVLALGQVVAHTPAVGVWLSAGFMTAAISWMLLVWLPPQWAVLAAIFGTVQLSMLSYWGHSYWGGAVPAAGGALAFGAFRLLVTRPRLVAGIILGAGLAILALSRPFEGGVAGVCIAFALGRLISGAVPSRVVLMRALLAAGCVVGVALGWLGYYNWRVTGSPLTMPYRVYQLEYSSNPFFLFGNQKAKPTYRHREMARMFHEWGEERKARQRTLIGLVRTATSKLVIIILSVLGFGVVALAGLRGILRRRQLRFAFASTAAVIGAALLTAGSFPHYVAPAAALIYVIAGAAFNHLHQKARRNRSANLAFVSVCVLVVAGPWFMARITATQTVFGVQRASVLRRLESLPEKSLVFVTYGPTHNFHVEWVQNQADLNAAKVVWARSMTADQDRQLIEYYPERRVWHLAPDRTTVLEPYSPAAVAAARER